jgi:hypothetical protein
MVTSACGMAAWTWVDISVINPVMPAWRSGNSGFSTASKSTLTPSMFLDRMAAIV